MKRAVRFARDAPYDCVPAPSLPILCQLKVLPALRSILFWTDHIIRFGSSGKLASATSAFQPVMQ